MKFYVESENPLQTDIDLVELNGGSVWKRFASPNGPSHPVFCMRCGKEPFSGWKQVEPYGIVYCNDCLVDRDRQFGKNSKKTECLKP